MQRVAPSTRLEQMTNDDCNTNFDVKFNISLSMPILWKVSGTV